jgi:lysophospholipase L1-like esterase
MIFRRRAEKGALPAEPPKRILVYGDSIAWGWVPQATFIPAERFPPEEQWPRVMAAELGAGFEVMVDALSGRTTDAVDPLVPEILGAALDGNATLPASLGAHLPLDLVVLMVGSNDLKPQFGRTALRIALGAGRLIETVQRSGSMFGTLWYTYPAPKVLLICPPPLEGLVRVAEELFTGWQERARGLAQAFAHVAAAAEAEFLDAATVVRCDGRDGCHLSGESQRRLGQAVAARVRLLLADERAAPAEPA